MNNAGISTPHSSTESGRSTVADVTNLDASEVRRKLDRERYASLSAEHKEARLQKNHEYKQRNEAATSQSATGSAQDENATPNVCTPSRKGSPKRYNKLFELWWYPNLFRNHDTKRAMVDCRCFLHLCVSLPLEGGHRR